MTPLTNVKKDRPKVSVITAVYNTERYLSDTLKSVLEQSFEDWEHVLIENGSQDSCRQILRRCTDPRVRIIELDHNIGVTGAFNCGIEHAHGEYIAILDSDDIALPDRLKVQVNFLDAHPNVALVGGRAILFGDHQADEPSELFPAEHEEIVREFCDRTPLGHSTVMYRADIARAVGGYPDNYKYAQDCGFYLRLIQNNFRLANLEDFLVRFRIHPQQASEHPDWAITRSRDNVTVFFQTRQFCKDKYPGLLSRNTVRIVRSYVNLATALIKNKKYLEGVSVVANAIWLSPFTFVKLTFSKMMGNDGK